MRCHPRPHCRQQTFGALESLSILLDQPFKFRDVVSFGHRQGERIRWRGSSLFGETPILFASAQPPLAPHPGRSERGSGTAFFLKYFDRIQRIIL